MKTIVLTSSKGGSGKTTLACHFAAALALRGKRVLLVDTDTQGHCALAFGVPRDRWLARFLSSDFEPRLCSRPQHSAYIPATCTSASDICLLTSTRDLLKLDVPTDALKLALGRIDDQFDACFIDTAPSPGDLLAMAYLAADCAIVPTQLKAFDLDGVIATVHDLARAHVPLAGIVPNLVKARTAVQQYNFVELQGFAAHNHLELWPPIAERTAWSEAAQNHRMVWMESPRSKAVAEFNALVDCVEALL